MSARLIAATPLPVEGHEMVLVDFDFCGLVVTGCGAVEDLAAQIKVEGGRDWRPLNNLARRTVSPAWPDIARLPGAGTICRKAGKGAKR